VKYKVSVYIIAYNEENKITDAIESVIEWADEVIVIDSFSTDNTISIAESKGAEVVQIPFNGFGDLRNNAIANCKNDWIFSLDSDERCTLKAKDEIVQIITSNQTPNFVAYYIPRRNYFMGQWINHSGWYPDYRQPQLFLKGTLSYNNDPVHEGFKVNGAIGKLTNNIIQFPFENLAQIIAKTNRYSTLGAEKLALNTSKKGGVRSALIHSISAFIQTWILKKGFLDGRAGFVIAIYNFTYTFYKYVKLKELRSNWKQPNYKL
jgi:glycosyltransferase involved in cell wall biosynthesis